MNMIKPRIILLGKLPPPHYGPAIATQIILNSSLRNVFEIYHINTKLNKEVTTIGKVGLRKVINNNFVYFRFLSTVLKKSPKLIIVPISQSTIGFIKDSFFILIGCILRKKIIIHLRGSNFKNWVDNSWLSTRLYVSFVLKRVSAVIVLGKNLKYLFSDYFTQDNIFVIPNGANYNIPKVVRDNDVFKILYLGNLQESKGIEDVIKAVKILKDINSKKFQLNVFGIWRDEVTKTECIEMVAKNNLPVTFFPPIFGENKLQCFADASVFVFTPREPEGHPWVIVEAMAAGLPIISTDQGAIKESVLDGKTGFIVENKNPERIAEKLALLMEDSKMKEQMGRASLSFYNQNFTEEKMVENLSHCFRTVLNQQ